MVAALRCVRPSVSVVSAGIWVTGLFPISLFPRLCPIDGLFPVAFSPWLFPPSVWTFSFYPCLKFDTGSFPMSKIFWRGVHYLPTQTPPSAFSRDSPLARAPPSSSCPLTTTIYFRGATRRVDTSQTRTVHRLTRVEWLSQGWIGWPITTRFVLRSQPQYASIAVLGCPRLVRQRWFHWTQQRIISSKWARPYWPGALVYLYFKLLFHSLVCA